MVSVLNIILVLLKRPSNQLNLIKKKTQASINIYLRILIFSCSLHFGEIFPMKQENIISHNTFARLPKKDKQEIGSLFLCKRNRNLSFF